METVIFLGLINWLVTVLLVESEITRPVREWVQHHYQNSTEYWEYTGFIPTVKGSGWKPVLWYKARYIVGCQLCTGVWVGFALALVAGTVIGSGFLGIVLSGLLYKSVGHIVLIGQKFMEAYS